MDLVDVRPVLGHVTGDLPASEGDVDSLSGFERDARRVLEARADQVDFGILVQLPVDVDTNGILGDGHGISPVTASSDALVNLGRFHSLDHARIVKTVLAQHHHFGADDGTFGQALAGRHFPLLSLF